MKPIGVVVVVFLSACFYTNRWNKSPGAHQRGVARRMSGSDLVVQGGPVQQVLEFRVRAWADPDYRAYTPHWKERFAERIARLNQFLVPELGARLVVLDDDLRTWEPSATGDLAAVWKELYALDPGDDVDWVVGLVGPPPVVTGAIHEMGIAAPLGKHLIIRSMNDAEEARAIEKVFDNLTKSEKTALFTSRKYHKEQIVFLHEWAHTLGAIHAHDEAWIMNPFVNADQRAFAEPENGFLRRALAARRATGADQAQAEGELLRYAEATEWERWDTGERAVLLSELRKRTAGSEELVAVAALGDPDRAAYSDAERLTVAGDYARAWDELAPVAASQVDVAPAQLLGCQLAAQSEVDAPASREACRRAIRLLPDDPLPLILFAWARVHDRAAAKDQKAKTQAATEALEAGAGAYVRLTPLAGAEGRWVQLAGVYQALGAITLAEQAVAHAGDANGADGVRAWVTQTRLLAAPAGIDPDDEPAYMERFSELYQAVSPSTAKKVSKEVDAALKTWPDAPGLLALRCTAQVYLGKLAAAQKSCDKAIALHADAVLARMTAAYIARRNKKPDAARAHLEHVITVDPTAEQAWQELGDVLESDPAALGELKRRYREARKKTWPY